MVCFKAFISSNTINHCIIIAPESCITSLLKTQQEVVHQTNQLKKVVFCRFYDNSVNICRSLVWISLTSWGEGSSLALVDHLMGQMFHGMKRGQGPPFKYQVLLLVQSSLSPPPPLSNSGLQGPPFQSLNITYDPLKQP